MSGMFNFKLLLVFLFIALVNKTVFSQKSSIAISNLDGTLDKKELATLTDRLVSEFTRTGRYVVLERNQMAQILKEQGFQQTGCTSNDCAVEVGQLLGVQSMVAGNIGKVGRIYSISIRMIDVRTAQITASSTVDIEGSVEEILKRGIPEIVQRISSSGKEKEPSRFNFRKAGGISCIVAGSATAATAAYFLVQRNNYHRTYLAQTEKTAMDSWFDLEKKAYYRFLGTAVATGVMVPVSFLLLRHSDKKETPVSFYYQGDKAGLFMTIRF